MFLQLALEYTEALNSKESPVVHTALERVLQAETIKTMDEAFEAFKNDLDLQLNEELLPIASKEFRKIVKRLRCKYQLIFQKQLANILSFQEILEET